MKMIKKTLITLLAALATAPAMSESMYDKFRDPNANTMRAFIFVSMKLSDTTLIALARDSRRAGVGLVLQGFIHEGPRGLEDTKARIADINRACCNNNVANWQINPILFKRYEVKAVPAFVIAKGSGNSSTDFSKVSGEMSLGTALKFFAQESRIPDIKKRAGQVYYQTFAGQD
ncbi:type-F conjugative transfer system pilin assembly protein TrbC [Herbaspirillum sp. RV1423]|uniref:type-F conjugative transfer system pilin assembly protein TrbC n=1 Tax=Herbaspirillum sp. RV1423 TaxID=1443993 RepID=UPI000684F579|nr:type-F conjugative transfer system pilin assembly protein TrbC [Herbaspirillum sp. RV1423]